MSSTTALLESRLKLPLSTSVLDFGCESTLLFIWLNLRVILRLKKGGSCKSEIKIGAKVSVFEKIFSEVVPEINGFSRMDLVKDLKVLLRVIVKVTNVINSAKKIEIPMIVATKSDFSLPRYNKHRLEIIIAKQPFNENGCL